MTPAPTTPPNQFWKDAITLAVALLGAILGVINTIHNLSRSRVRLKIIPKTVKMNDSGTATITSSIDVLGPGLCIEVINFGAIPVTINEVGFHLRGSEKRAACACPMVFDGGGWPRRLEPRQAVTAHVDTTGIPLHLVKRAYATSDCDETHYGKSRALQKFLSLDSPA